MRLTLVGVVLALALVAGCGGSSQPDDAATALPSAGNTMVVILNPTGAAAAVAVTKEYLDAFISGRAARVCALETPAFVARQLESAVASKFITKGTGCIAFIDKVVATSKKANPSPGAALAFEATAFAADEHDATVRVDYPASSGASPDTYLLVKVGGSWLVDANP